MSTVFLPAEQSATRKCLFRTCASFFGIAHLAVARSIGAAPRNRSRRRKTGVGPRGLCGSKPQSSTPFRTHLNLDWGNPRRHTAGGAGHRQPVDKDRRVGQPAGPKPAVFRRPSEIRCQGSGPGGATTPGGPANTAEEDPCSEVSDDDECYLTEFNVGVRLRPRLPARRAKVFCLGLLSLFKLISLFGKPRR